MLVDDRRVLELTVEYDAESLRWVMCAELVYLWECFGEKLSVCVECLIIDDTTDFSTTAATPMRKGPASSSSPEAAGPAASSAT